MGRKWHIKKTLYRQTRSETRLAPAINDDCVTTAPSILARVGLLDFQDALAGHPAFTADITLLDVIRRVAKNGHPMASLRTAMSAASAFDPDAAAA